MSGRVSNYHYPTPTFQTVSLGDLVNRTIHILAAIAGIQGPYHGPQGPTSGGQRCLAPTATAPSGPSSTLASPPMSSSIRLLLGPAARGFTRVRRSRGL